MSNTISVQDFYLLDQDSNLPTEQSVVAVFKDVVTSDSDTLTIQSLLIENDIQGIIELSSYRNRSKIRRSYN